MSLSGPMVESVRSLVWTDAAAQAQLGRNGGRVACWFWSVSGPRGHMNGGEATADEALRKVWAAMELVQDPMARRKGE